MTPGADSLRVAHVVLDFPVRSEQFVAREVAALQRVGVRVQVLALRPTAAGSGDALGDAVWRPPARAARSWGGALTSALQRPAETRRALRALAEIGGEGRRGGALGSLRWLAVALHFAERLRADPPDVVHAHFASLPATVGLLLAELLGLPFGFSTHARDLYAEPVAWQPKVRRARHVLACSECAANDVRQRIAPALRARVHALHHGLDLSEWHRVEPGCSAAAGGPDTALVLAGGRWVPKKGFDHLIRACAALRDASHPFRCRLVGEGPLAGALRRRIRELDLGDHVQLAPWCTAEAWRAQLERAAALVVPSVVAGDGDRDNIPNVVVEALACGTPVVASALPALKQLLAPRDAAELVAPGDPSALADAIRACVDPKRARCLADNGRALAEEHFDERTNALALRRILEQSARAEPPRVHAC